MRIMGAIVGIFTGMQLTVWLLDHHYHMSYDLFGVDIGFLSVFLGSTVIFMILGSFVGHCFSLGFRTYLNEVKEKQRMVFESHLSWRAVKKGWRQSKDHHNQI